MSNKIKKTKLGFTVIELIIVISIVGVVASASFAMFGENRKKAVLDDAQASVINALEQARSRAATGVGTTSHGVKIEGNIISECKGEENSCIVTSSTTLKSFISTDKSNLTIVFNRLSATSSVATTITIFTLGESATVSVAQDGIIKK